MDFPRLTEERKVQLHRISKLRGNRDIVVYAADITKQNSSIDFTDILPFQDQLSNLKGSAIDVILETPGGLAEAVEDMVKLLRSKYEQVGIIVPGTAKSAGTIFTMAGDEILMGPISSLGPIDAQIINPQKRYSADAFLEGLEKIKVDVQRAGKLNPAYIPILQNISPGEIQHCENALNFSKTLVTQWLTNYKFKFWDRHSSTDLPVTIEEKQQRARSIADELCKHSKWLTHGRSIQISDLEQMRLKITNYGTHFELNDAITRYYTLLKMTFESTNIYKLIETPATQILRHAVANVQPQTQRNDKADSVVFKAACPQCKTVYEFQAKLSPTAKSTAGKIAYPKNNIFICPKCNASINLMPARLQIESQTGKKFIV